MSLDELRELLRRHARPGLTTAIDGVRVCMADHAVAPVSSMSGTVLAIVAQGGKRLALGDRVYEYGAGQYLVASVDLPVTGHFVDTARPSLGFGMTLEPAVIAELLLQAGPGELPRSTAAAPPGIAVSDAPDELLDAVVRLLRLLDRPGDRKMLAPLVKREILWRLLTGEQGEAVRQLGLADSSLSHIDRAVRWIREHYTQPFRVEELARLSGMSVSAFHRNFLVVTGMSPIRFQKQIRLQAARLLLANRPHDVTGVGQRVGYDNPSQFSREYRRQFGVPPSVDAARLRDGAGPAVALP
ncbi:AraC-type DNA-binding protein [Nonomuraea maritima]|uniref:AraC-type DNA-binding protein n=1 Tax=Nonomuraea maritima TaxID=683260 RepID=A0A1G9HPU1_9ACTN|nr:AraC family transcriptional regulator [Nonomuraea maritima]SDL14950.1 AraC-type DNA-binding protein [Nonomuraea maritima]